MTFSSDLSPLDPLIRLKEDDDMTEGGEIVRSDMGSQTKHQVFFLGGGLSTIWWLLLTGAYLDGLGRWDQLARARTRASARGKLSTEERR